MGGCVSDQASKLMEEDHSLQTRPFFRRQESLYGTHSQPAHSQINNVWEERQLSGENSRNFSPEVKETVLQNEWWKCQSEAPDDELPSFQLFDENGIYDEIDESKIRPSLELMKENHSPPIPPPLLSQLKTVDNNDPCAKKNLSAEESKKGRPGCRSRLPLPPRIASQCTELPRSEANLAEDTDKLTAECKTLTSVDQCLEYSEMVNIFKPLIVQNLLVHDILPYLPFLDNHDDIYSEMKNHSQKNAVVCLLNELENSRELGKWQKFIDALSACGYTYIVDNIRGYKFISHEYQKEYIRTLTPKLSKMIVPAELLPYLLARGIIGDSDKENIQREDENRGHIAGAVLLLDRITRKHRYWYKLFIEALIDVQMDDVVADLRIPKLLEDNRTKVTYDSYNADDGFLYTLPPCPSSEHSPLAKVNNEDVEVEMSSRKLDPSYSEDITCNNEFFDKVYSVNCEPPPLPPRIPVIRRPRVPLLLERTSVCYEEYTDVDLQTTVLQGEGFDCETSEGTNETYNYETYDDYTGASFPNSHEDDMNINCRGETKKEDPVIPQFQVLRNNLEKMKKEKEFILVEVDLLEQKSALSKEVNNGLKRRRELQEDIALKEKERQALQSSDCLSGENTDVTDDITDEYYPTRSGHNVDHQSPVPLTRYGTRCTFDFRQLTQKDPFPGYLPLHIDSPLTTVQLYSPTFESKSLISDLFEQDSGIGKDIIL